jgi:hypothetical protein
VQFFQCVLGHAEAPAAARPSQPALDRPATSFQQIAAGGKVTGGKHEEQDERGEQPGRIERQ